MTPAKPTLVVAPELCAGCRNGDRDCERACKEGALKVGSGYIFVDWEKCTACLACVEMCDAGALKPRPGIVSAVSPGSLGAGDSAGAPDGERLPVSASGQLGQIAAPDWRVGGGVKGLRPIEAAPEDGDPGIWTGADAVLVLLVLLATLLGLHAVLDSDIVKLMPPSGRIYARSAGLAVAYCIEIVLIWAIARARGVRFDTALGLRPVARSYKSASISAALVLGILVVARIATSAYGLVSARYGWEPVYKWSTDVTTVLEHRWLGLALTLALVVAVGPFVEEVIFRGVVQRAGRKRFGPWGAILVTSVLFGVYHFDSWMFAPTFALSLGLGWLAERRGGLWPPILLHTLYNGVTVTAAFWLASQRGA